MEKGSNNKKRCCAAAWSHELKLHKIRVVFFFIFWILSMKTIHGRSIDICMTKIDCLQFFFENATESRPTNINQIQLIFMKLFLLKNSQRLKKFCNIFRNKTLYGTFYL